MLNARNIAAYYAVISESKVEKLNWDLVNEAIKYYRDRKVTVYLLVRENLTCPWDKNNVPAGVEFVELDKEKDTDDLAILLKAKELECQFVDNCPYNVDKDKNEELSKWYSDKHVTYYFDTEGKFNPLPRVEDAMSGEASDDDHDAPSSSAGLPQSEGKHVVLNCASIGNNYVGKPRPKKRSEEDTTLFWKGVKEAFYFYHWKGVKVHLVVRMGDLKDLVRCRCDGVFDKDVRGSFVIVPVSDAMKDNDDLVTLHEANKWNCEFVDNDNYKGWSNRLWPWPSLAHWFAKLTEHHVKFHFNADDQFELGYPENDPRHYSAEQLQEFLKNYVVPTDHKELVRQFKDWGCSSCQEVFWATWKEGGKDRGEDPKPYSSEQLHEFLQTLFKRLQEPPKNSA